MNKKGKGPKNPPVDVDEKDGSVGVRPEDVIAYEMGGYRRRRPVEDEVLEEIEREESGERKE